MDTEPVLDRQTTTPFYLKLFYKSGGFHRPDEFTSATDLPNHVQIYTWPTCTLRELSHLLVSALPSLLPDPSIGTRLSFRLTFPDTRNPNSVGPGRYMTKELGSIVIGDGGPGILPNEEEAAIVAGGVMAGALHGEPEKTLQDAKFVIGDYIDCAIVPPLENGSVAPPIGRPPGRGGFGGGRGMNDFGGRGNRDDGGFGYRGGRGGMRGGGGPGGFNQGMVPQGEWRRGERLPDRGERVPEGPSGGGGKGRGFGGGFGGGGRGGERW